MLIIGNFEFQLYDNNRTNSYVRDGVLYIKPTLMYDHIGEAMTNGGSVYFDLTQLE
jgi:hypothetical protein